MIPVPSRVDGVAVLRPFLTLALLVGLVAACAGQPPSSTTSATVRASTEPSSKPTVEASASPSEGPGDFAPTGATEEARVVRVIDGDTIVVDRGQGDERLRYIGMDTPETVKPGTSVEWMGRESADANRALVEGATVVLEQDVSETDRYGRLLRHVWLDDDGAGWRLVNLELIRVGYARVSTYPPDVKYVDLYLAAQIDAREHDRGLWGAGPITFLSPADGATVTTKTIVVQGTGPAGSRIVRDISNAPDKSLRVAADGTWSMEIKLRSGLNSLRFRVDDEKVTTRTLQVVYAP